LYVLQATIGIDFLSKTMYLEDRTVSTFLYLQIKLVCYIQYHCCSCSNHCHFFFMFCSCLQCFDTVGWAARRASGL